MTTKSKSPKTRVKENKADVEAATEAAPEPKKQDSMSEWRKTRRQVKVPITDDEQRLKGEQLAQATMRHREIEAEKKRVNDDIKDRLKSVAAVIGRLEEDISSRTEDRVVDLDIELDHRANRVRHYYNGEHLEYLDREMSLAERQITIAGTEPETEDDATETPVAEEPEPDGPVVVKTNPDDEPPVDDAGEPIDF